MKVLNDFEIQQVSGGDLWSSFRDSFTQGIVGNFLNWIYPGLGNLAGQAVWQGLADALSTPSSSSSSSGGDSVFDFSNVDLSSLGFDFSNFGGSCC